MYPDFIGIGAQKAGTTWLARNLQAHPEIHMPRKEVHYFDRKIRDKRAPVARFFGKRDADVQWRRQVKRIPNQLLRNPSLQDLRWNLRYYMTSYDDGWYASVFEPKNGKVSGEITPAYSVQDRERVAHVHSLMPDAKIIFMMRNPIERAWSQTVMSFDKVEKGSAKSASEEELFRKLGRNSTWKLSNYLRTFENWGAFYPPERFFVGFLEDSSFMPRELLREVYSFLGVDPSFEPPLTEKKVHTRSAGTMPAKVAVHLAQYFGEEISRLSDRFGGYASFWRFCAERLIEDPPQEEEITYPLFESALWEEWSNGSENPSGLGSHRLQSGTLSSIQVAT
jgi:hypothetical protein